jgi:hypothetical protein
VAPRRWPSPSVQRATFRRSQQRLPAVAAALKPTVTDPSGQPRATDDEVERQVYVEDLIDADYLDRPEAVRAYNALWNRLQAAALGPVESRDLILRVADETRSEREHDYPGPVRRGVAKE